MNNLKTEHAVMLVSGLCASLFADIVYETPDSPLLFGAGYDAEPAQYESFDLNSDGRIDYTFGASPTLFTGVRPEGNNQYLITPDPPPNIGGSVKRLDGGSEIGSDSGNVGIDWYGLNSNFGTIVSYYSGYPAGEFPNSRGYIGVEFESDEGTHYGWFDIEGQIYGVSIWIHSWAYESTPGKSIVAGAIPEPSSVLLITVGATGIWMARKKIFR